MISTLGSIDRGMARRLSVALLGAATLAACNSDRVAAPTTRPSAASTPSTAKAGLGLAPGTLIIRTVTPGVLAVGATYTIQHNYILATVVDNGPGDNDYSPGTITFGDVGVGQYYICETEAPWGHEIAHPDCATFTVASHDTTKATFFNPPLQSASWEVRDWYDVLQFPTTFNLSSGRGLGTTIVDDGPNDLDKRPGRLSVKLPFAGKFTLCQKVPSAGHWVANPACVPVDDTSGRGIWVGTFVEPLAQVYKP